MVVGWALFAGALGWHPNPGTAVQNPGTAVQKRMAVHGGWPARDVAPSTSPSLRGAAGGVADMLRRTPSRNSQAILKEKDDEFWPDLAMPAMPDAELQEKLDNKCAIEDKKNYWLEVAKARRIEAEAKKLHDAKLTEAEAKKKLADLARHEANLAQEYVEEMKHAVRASEAKEARVKDAMEKTLACLKGEGDEEYQPRQQAEEEERRAVQDALNQDPALRLAWEFSRMSDDEYAEAEVCHNKMTNSEKLYFETYKESVLSDWEKGAEVYYAAGRPYVSYRAAGLTDTYVAPSGFIGSVEPSVKHLVKTENFRVDDASYISNIKINKVEDVGTTESTATRSRTTVPFSQVRGASQM